jgi:uncharacterized cupin superfamily protein
VGTTHFDEAPASDFEIGHLQGHWTDLGRAAGSVTIGARRIEVPAGAWATPAHEHGLDEEIFFVLSGSGISWQAGRTAQVRAGDCIVYLAARGAHTLHALEPVDVLAFGPRHRDEAVGFPRLGLSLVGRRAVESVPGVVDRAPIQFVREAELGPPELPETPGDRPGSIVNLDDVEPVQFGRGGRVSAQRRDLGKAAGSQRTGCKHVEVEPGHAAAPAHCHSHEEEIFVILEGEGTLRLGDEETPVRPGHVIARPAGTRVAHMFRAGSGGLSFLVYGTREPGDMCFYPDSNKVSFRGLGVIARLEQLDYWDGEL